jgi:hypothetical protein
MIEFKCYREKNYQTLNENNLIYLHISIEHINSFYKKIV